MIGAISMVKNAENSIPSFSNAVAPLACKIEGNIAVMHRYENKPAITVAQYAMVTVNKSIRLAPLPMSAMADVTKATMMSGIRNLSSWSKMPLKVLNARTMSSGTNVPKPMPSIIAMMIRTKSGMRWKFVFVGFIVHYSSSFSKSSESSKSNSSSNSSISSTLTP